MSEEKKEEMQQPINSAVVVKSTRSSRFRRRLLSVLEYVGKEVLLPRLIDATEDAVTTTTHSLLHKVNESPGRITSSSRPKAGSSYISYNNYAKPARSAAVVSSTDRSVYDFATLTFDTRVAAQSTLFSMRQVIEKEHKCSVRKFYDIANAKDENGNRVGTPQDVKYGWYSLDETEAKVKIDPVNKRWYLDLPPATPFI